MKLQQQYSMGAAGPSYQNEQENTQRGVNKLVKPIRGGGGKRMITPRTNLNPMQS